MNVEEKENSRKIIWKQIQENKLNREKCIEKIELLNQEFEDVKNSSSFKHQCQTTNLKYLFKLEQHVLNRMPLVKEVEKYDHYSNRLFKVSEYINARYANKEILKRMKAYELNSIIQVEALHHYDSQIKINQQRLITFKRWNEYCEFVKEHYFNQYEKQQRALEIIELETSKAQKIKNQLIMEKQLLMTHFKNDRFQTEALLAISKKLVDKDIIMVVCEIYPDFKDKLLSLREGEQGKISVSIQQNNDTYEIDEEKNTGLKRVS